MKKHNFDDLSFDKTPFTNIVLSYQDCFIVMSCLESYLSEVKSERISKIKDTFQKKIKQYPEDVKKGWKK